MHPLGQNVYGACLEEDGPEMLANLMRWEPSASTLLRDPLCQNVYGAFIEQDGPGMLANRMRL